MAKIQNVDYVAIPNQAKQMRQYGKDLNNELTSAYKSVADMHTSWYGQRYNALVKEFNKITTEINELLTLVVTEIPYTLETIANNYSQADRGSNATTAVKESPKKITNISISNDVGMKFLTEQVTTVQSNVSKNFQNAKAKMNTIETEYGKIKWQSEASEAFKVKFKKLKNDIVKAFEDINSSFTKLMNQTKEDIQKAESANTVK